METAKDERERERETRLHQATSQTLSDNSQCHHSAVIHLHKQ